MYDPKVQIEGVTPINHSASEKSRLNDLSYGMKTWTHLSSVLSQCMHLTDGRADSFFLIRPPCIQCCAVKSK